MKRLILDSVMVIIIAGLCIAAGYGMGYDKRTEETNKILKSSIAIKKKYSQYQIIYPVQIINSKKGVVINET